PPDLGLDATATERAGLGPVAVNEHGRPGLLRRRPARGDDRATGARQTAVDHALEFGEQFAHQYARAFPDRFHSSNRAAHSACNSPLSTVSGLLPSAARSLAGTNNSWNPAAAASAIVAPNTTRSIFAQWIADKHIGHGSVVEY